MALSDGYVYVHRLKAEEKLKRPLKSTECVHHIDENKLNNSCDNLMVFKTNADHSAFHKGSTPVFEGDVWICLPTSQKLSSKICPICNSEFTPIKENQKYCGPECVHKSQHKCTHPTKDQLEQLILRNSILTIAKMYGVSDNSIRKWCKNYELPYKQKDINEFRINYIPNV